MSTGDPHLATQLRECLLKLCKKAEAEEQQKAIDSADLRRCLSALRRDPRFRPITYQELGRLLHANPDQISTGWNGGLVPLPIPVTNRFVPMVNAFYAFSADDPEVRLQVACFTAPAGVLMAHGFRFETPEAGDNHRYFHAQPLLNIRQNDRQPPLQLPGLGQPVSDRSPTFPLEADHFIELFFCMLIALYGRRGAWDHAHPLFDSACRKRLQSMRVYAL